MKSAPIRRALISVSDKTGVLELAQCLHASGADIIASSGTAKLLAQNKIAAREVSDLTGFPEIFGGRVKTLHPKVHGALLARGERDQQEMEAHGIEPIDLLAVNLYPFVETTRAQHSVDDALEQIDIGGVALIRAAAKNYQRVVVVVDPADYPLIEALQKDGVAIAEAERLRLARKAFAHVANYDAAISAWFSEQSGELPESCAESTLQTTLRYGENPHQRAAFYQHPYSEALRLLQGKALSYNNYLDADSAYKIALDLNGLNDLDTQDGFVCAIVKHNNPCGVAIRDSALAAYQAAYACDSTSAFGGVIAFAKELDAETATQIIAQQFLEVIVAPSFSDEALAVLKEKEQLRAVVGGKDVKDLLQQRSIAGGLLVQDEDKVCVNKEMLQIVSQRQANDDEVRDMLFAQRVVKHVRSNGIVFAKNRSTIGIGAGQMSRVDSVEIALRKAAQAGLDCAGSVLASDAFFPFQDSIERAQEIGVTAIIQPGGSKNDAEVIAAVDQYAMAMAFTGVRHFKH